jgi:hypothetical protein
VKQYSIEPICNLKTLLNKKEIVVYGNYFTPISWNIVHI